jgi:hypothetical protein
MLTYSLATVWECSLNSKALQSKHFRSISQKRKSRFLKIKPLSTVRQLIHGRARVYS